MRRSMIVMPKSQSRLGMTHSHLALFQLLISLTGMPGMLYPAITNRRYAGARPSARALRVGIGKHCGHDTWAFNYPIHSNLRACHAQSSGVIGHDISVPVSRNLLFFGAKVSGAAVPLAFRAARAQEFYGTLAPSTGFQGR